MNILQPTHRIIDTLMSAISSAQYDIFFQMYYIDNDSVFEKFAEKLIEKAKQGVMVYCLFDALGAKDIFESEIEKKLLEAGVRIRYFNWLTPWANRSKKLWYFRNHKRSLIIDSKALHTGGWCIGEATQDWIEGYVFSKDEDAVTQSVKDFWNMYTYAHKTQIRFRHQRIFTYKPEDIISYTYQAPMIQSRYMYYTYKKLFRNATKKIVLISPYFSPTHTIIKKIRKAQSRGIEVEIFIPHKTDIPFTDLVGKTYIHNLLTIGVSVYMVNIMIHAKASLFDDVLYVGSMNLDSVSLRYNFENGIYTRDKDIIQSFEQDLTSLKEISHKLTLEEWNQRSLWNKFLDIFMKIFRAFV